MPRSIIYALLLLSGLTACDGQPPTSSVAEPELNWMNNPDNGNIRIARFQEHFAVSWTDPRNGLRATHTTFPLGNCGPQVDLDPLSVQDVGLFVDGDEFFLSWLHRNAKGRLWVIVRDPSQPGSCFGNKLIAEGWGEMHATDNDLFGAGPDDNNANAWGFGGRGTLITPQLKQVRYSGHARFTFTGTLDDEGFPVFAHEQFFVNLK